MKHLHPLRESQIRGNDCAHGLVSSCKQLKKQFCAGLIKCDITKLIDDQKIDLLELPDLGGKLILISRLHHLVDQTSSRPKRYAIILLAGSNSNCYRQMSLASS